MLNNLSKIKELGGKQGTDIILMHNGTKDTAAVLPELIRQLKEKGYEFKPISEFIYKDNYVIDHAGMQKLN